MSADRVPTETDSTGFKGSARISPTAHYTGYTWLAHGLSHPAFATSTGRILYRALQPANLAFAAAGYGNLDGLLLARHTMIDFLLRQAIAERRVGQVIEIACGLSPRGYRFAREFAGEVTYIEADLPPMAARKRELLARAGGGGPHHRVVSVDATASDGPLCLAEIVRTLDPTRGLAIVTEGLLNYFALPAVAGMWRRFAAALAGFPHGLYLSDLHLRDETGSVERLFAGLLGVFVRGKIHFHFADAEAANSELRASGFADVQLRRPEQNQALTGFVDPLSARLVRVIHARRAATDDRGWNSP